MKGSIGTSTRIRRADRSPLNGILQKMANRLPVEKRKVKINKLSLSKEVQFQIRKEWTGRTECLPGLSKKFGLSEKYIYHIAVGHIE